MTGAEQTPQERRLAQFLFRRACAQFGLIADWPDNAEHTARRTAMENAAAILDSDVIREMRQQDRARGWDRCVSDARLLAGSPVSPTNPYRQEASDGQ